ncbi:hypothetical protein RRG08_049327 [Elysia crispata]|uniref:Uncharacterized protein n=1 Tax=Elysia crispata TaxID=231223 RepID=A0AAE0XE20_9GAST|nr:hypothetical protein RRG08_049327 [Elysia crispata]
MFLPASELAYAGFNSWAMILISSSYGLASNNVTTTSSQVSLFMIMRSQQLGRRWECVQVAGHVERHNQLRRRWECEQVAGHVESSTTWETMGIDTINLGDDGSVSKLLDMHYESIDCANICKEMRLWAGDCLRLVGHV